VRYEEFERRARELWASIPREYKRGVDGLVVERRARPHPTLRDIYTLGECLTEAYLSDYEGPETTRSVVVLYYGSFQRLARLDPDFDWEEELWETLTHELRHHLESLAREDRLDAQDYAADENFKRREGEPFDPLFYRSGERVGERAYRVEEDIFVEREYRDGREPDGWIEFEWEGARYRVPRPAELGDVCYVTVEEGIDCGGRGELCLVLLRRRGLAASLRDWLRGTGVRVEAAAAAAERVG